MNKNIVPILVFCAFFVSAEQSHAAFSWEDNIVAHYKMNDNADNTTVLDNMGFSNGTAQQNTSALHTDGKILGALTFNGTSDYVATSAMDEQPSMSFWLQEAGSEDWNFIANSSGTAYVNGEEAILYHCPAYYNGTNYVLGYDYYGEQGKSLTPTQSFEGKIPLSLGQIGTNDFSMGFWFKTGEQVSWLSPPIIYGNRSPDYFAISIIKGDGNYTTLGWYQGQDYFYGGMGSSTLIPRSYNTGTVSSTSPPGDCGIDFYGTGTNWSSRMNQARIYYDILGDEDVIDKVMTSNYLIGWGYQCGSCFENSTYDITWDETLPTVYASYDYTPGEVWHFLMMTVDRDGPEGLKLWLDGVIVETADPTDFEGIDLSPGETGTINLNFGANAAGYPIQNQWFDDFQLYIGETLSQEDISYLYNNRNGRKINENSFSFLVNNGFYVDFNGVTDGTYPGAMGGGYDYGVQMRKLVDGVWSNDTISFANYGGKVFTAGGLPVVNGSFFECLIDNFMIFNGALSDDEVAELYNLGDGTENQYEITGRVTLSGGTTDVTDVLLTLSGATTETTNPDANGNYSFTCWERFDYTVIPSLESYRFSPVGYSYTYLDNDQTGQDFDGMYFEVDIKNNYKDDKGYQCFLTNLFAVAGTDDNKILCEIRNFRDSYLLTNPMGEMLVSAYYKTSPTLAEFIKEHPILRNTAKTLFYPLVWISKKDVC